MIAPINNVGNDALVVPGVENNNPSIFIWVPRFVYRTNENGETEIGYIQEETIPRRWMDFARLIHV